VAKLATTYPLLSSELPRSPELAGRKNVQLLGSVRENREVAAHSPDRSSEKKRVTPSAKRKLSTLA
jgi:hypothetical protein